MSHTLLARVRARRVKDRLVALLSVVGVAVALPLPARPSELALTGTAWRILEVAGQPADPAATISFEKSRVSGSTGCNRFFGAMAIKGPAITLGPLMTTKMYCGLRAGIERDTLAALAKSSRAKREGGKVVLLDAGGKPVIVLGH